eukprot:COSAG01_NODE_7941_length_2981_cov_1809.999653_1_plen_617_part_01
MPKWARKDFEDPEDNEDPKAWLHIQALDKDQVNKSTGNMAKVMARRSSTVIDDGKNHWMGQWQEKNVADWMLHQMLGDEFDNPEFRELKEQIEKNVGEQNITGKELLQLKKADLKTYLGIEKLGYQVRVMKGLQEAQKQLRMGIGDKLCNALVGQIAQLRGAMGALYDFMDQPVPFFYVHLLYLTQAIYLPLLAYAVAVFPHFKDKGSICSQRNNDVHGIDATDQIKSETVGFCYGRAGEEIVGLFIVGVVTIVVVGLSKVCEKLADPYGHDDTDLNVRRFVWYTLRKSRELIEGAEIVSLDEGRLHRKERHLKLKAKWHFALSEIMDKKKAEGGDINAVIKWFHNAGAGKGDGDGGEADKCDCTYCRHKHPCKNIPAVIKTGKGHDDITVYYPCKVCALHTPCGEFPTRTKCRCAICGPKAKWHFALSAIMDKKKAEGGDINAVIEWFHNAGARKGDGDDGDDIDNADSANDEPKKKTEGVDTTTVAEQEGIDNDDSGTDDNRGHTGYRCGWVPRKVLQLLLLIVSAAVIIVSVVVQMVFVLLIHLFIYRGFRFAKDDKFGQNGSFEAPKYTACALVSLIFPSVLQSIYILGHCFHFIWFEPLFVRKYDFSAPFL